jgi:hypothetical protein
MRLNLSSAFALSALLFFTGCGLSLESTEQAQSNCDVIGARSVDTAFLHCVLEEGAVESTTVSQLAGQSFQLLAFTETVFQYDRGRDEYGKADLILLLNQAGRLSDQRDEVEVTLRGRTEAYPMHHAMKLSLPLGFQVLSDGQANLRTQNYDYRFSVTPGGQTHWSARSTRTRAVNLFDVFRERFLKGGSRPVYRASFGELRDEYGDVGGFLYRDAELDNALVGRIYLKSNSELRVLSAVFVEGEAPRTQPAARSRSARQRAERRARQREARARRQLGQPIRTSESARAALPGRWRAVRVELLNGSGDQRLRWRPRRVRINSALNLSGSFTGELQRTGGNTFRLVGPQPLRSARVTVTHEKQMSLVAVAHRGEWIRLGVPARQLPADVQVARLRIRFRK